MNNRTNEIEDIIKKLDLTPAMYKNAKEKYDALRDFLKEKDKNIIFYPHGSFVLGTTVRPYKEQRERNYDLDSICLFNKTSEETDPLKIQSQLKDWLKSTDIYKSKLDVYPRCITINYADYGSVEFSIDVVPAAGATPEKKLQMIINGCEHDYAKTAIEIAEVYEDDNDNNKWISSNPQAYAKWFEEINAPFASENRVGRKKKIYESNKDIYKSEEDVPEYFNKSSLQMAIQLLKRARDVYFSKLGKENEKLKPISAIISTIVMDTADRSLIPYSADVMEVIGIVLGELKIYSKYQSLSEDTFKSLYESKVTIRRNKTRWEMWNPVNLEDNLVDSWNKNPDCAKFFFKWVSELEKVIEEIFDENNIEYERKIGNIFGSKIVEDYYGLSTIKTVQRGPSPWKKM